MGWWQTSNGGVIGDPPADVLDECDRTFESPDEIPDGSLVRIRDCYRAVFRRDPTQEELRDLIAFCRG